MDETKQIKITVENIQVSNQKDLEKLRKFYKELEKMTRKHLIPIGEKQSIEDIKITYQNSVFRNVSFESRYDFDRMITGNRI